jgi:aldose 1-epimerase
VRAKTDRSITFAYTSPDGDMGFPGEVDALITYTLTGENRSICASKQALTATDSRQ